MQAGDAKIVEALHSGMPLQDWSLQLQISRGIKETLGTIDIYVNGGGVHPACYKYVYILNLFWYFGFFLILY